MVRQREGLDRPFDDLAAQMLARRPARPIHQRGDDGVAPARQARDVVIELRVLGKGVRHPITVADIMGGPEGLVRPFHLSGGRRGRIGTRRPACQGCRKDRRDDDHVFSLETQARRIGDVERPERMLRRPLSSRRP